MADKKGPPDGEHIEELLSQLKGIFGHLSETEKEEAKQKITPPKREAPEPTPPPASEPAFEPAAESAPEPLPDLPLADMPPLSEPEPTSPGEPFPIEPPPAPSATFGDAYTPNEVAVPPGATLVPSAIFYPAGRINEAKILSDKVEKITPKFTKVAVVIHVQALAAYDAKGDIKSNILSQLQNTPIKAVLVLVEKALDDARRKGMIAALEANGIYFQEVPLQQIEKKALYTDMLLGMVFFFDSQKPPGGETSNG